MRKLLLVALPIGLAVLGAVTLVQALRARTEAADARAAYAPVRSSARRESA